MEVSVLKMTHEHLNDILTPDQMKDARFEARHRHPNINMDEIMEIEFCNYVGYKNDSLLIEETDQDIKHRFKEMVNLGYSPACIQLYEQIYIAIKDTKPKDLYS